MKVGLTAQIKQEPSLSQVHDVLTDWGCVRTYRAQLFPKGADREYTMEHYWVRNTSTFSNLKTATLVAGYNSESGNTFLMMPKHTNHAFLSKHFSGPPKNREITTLTDKHIAYLYGYPEVSADSIVAGLEDLVDSQETLLFRETRHRAVHMWKCRGHGVIIDYRKLSEPFVSVVILGHYRRDQVEELQNSYGLHQADPFESLPLLARQD